MKPNYLPLAMRPAPNIFFYGVFGAFLFSVLLFGSCTSLEAPIDRRVVNDGEFKQELSITAKTPRALPKRSYFWFRSQDVHTSQNDYAGLLLDGPYTKYYHTNELAEKGRFKKGLKTDKWTTWHKNGLVAEVVKWRKGRRTGKFISRDSSGNTIAYGSFKKGSKTGFWIDQSQGDTLYYHKGKEIVMDSALRAKFHRPSFFKRAFGFLKKKGSGEVGAKRETDSAKTGFLKGIFKKKDKKAKGQKAGDNKKKLSQKERTKLVRAKQSPEQGNTGNAATAKDGEDALKKTKTEKRSRDRRKDERQRGREAGKKGKKVARQKEKDSRKSDRPGFFKRLFGKKEKKSDQNETNA